VEGIEVPHMHIHLIPTMLNTNIVQRTHTTYLPGEATEVAQRIGA
jgi:diadenosine tetraphosphate (Ap4A) HIT family hydrolase